MGYYSRKDSSIGATGDFVTSSEVSQMFGELLGCWFGHRMRFGINYTLLELGPGNGTLLNDVLRTFQTLNIKERLNFVSVLECNPWFRGKQEAVLKANSTKHEFLDTLEDFALHNEGLIILAHEFFDAIPIHAFVRESNQHRFKEVLIDSVDKNFGMVLSSGRTIASSFLRIDEMFPKSPNSVEVSPQSWKLARILSMIGQSSEHCIGLIIDYGQYGPSTGSLRAIKNHRVLNSLFENIGDVDLSADVDFRAIATYFESKFQCSFSEQGDFLSGLGIKERMKALTKLNPQHESAISNQVKRLTDPEQMGRKYKVFSFESRN